MENYKRGKRVVEEITRESIPIPNLSDDFVWMQISAGSKMKNVLFYAINAMQRGKQVVWTGVGSTVGKAISCAEILKRKFKAHQITKICYRKVEEYWEPRTSNLETLVVNREVPTIHILISVQELDVNEPGYQSPTDNPGFWKPTTLQPSVYSQEPKPFRPRKRPDLLKYFYGGS